MCLMKKRNYKVYADVGQCRTILTRKFSVLDKGAAPNFIRASDLPPGVDKIRYGPLPNLSDENNNPIRMIGLDELVVRLGNRIVKVEFIVCERLAAPVIFGCDFCDRFVEAIFFRKRLIEMDDGRTVPITRRSLRHPYKQVRKDLKQDEAEKLPLGGRVSPKVRVAMNVVLSPETQTWVTVTTKRHGLAVIQLNDDLYHRESISATNGIVQVTGRTGFFRVLVANFGRTLRSLAKNQVIGTLLSHPTAILPTKMSFEDVVGMVRETPKAKLTGRTQLTSQKSNLPKIKKVKMWKNWISRRWRSAIEKNYALCCENYFKMLRKYPHIWNGSLGEITTTERSVNIESIWFLGHAPFRQSPIGLDQKRERRNKTKLIACYAQA